MTVARGKALHPHLAVLSTREKGELFDKLLRTEPGLADIAEEAARRKLVAVDRGDVAELVASSLASHSHEEIGDRAGYRPGRGYVEPAEAASEILDEELEVFLAQIGRCAALGLEEAARATALGVLAGLSRCEGGLSEETLLGWVPDFAWEAARSAVDVLGKWNITLHADEVEVAAPGWGESFGDNA